MATINLSVVGKMREVITTLIFRNKASVAIRKVKREKAFTQAVDIIITSIAYNLSENFKAEPPIQFYGYAVLVMQDCTEIAIPIVSARQRIYYGVQHEAIRQWRHWIEFYQLYQLHRFNDISLASIMGALEIPYTENLPEIKENEWIELPIREVYVKLQDKTQFKLEFTQWEPIPFTDPINDVEIDGKSKQEDGDKDNGLPKDGMQPKKNQPNNPFGGNPSPTSIQNAGQNGFDLVDSSNLSQPDPANLPDPSGLGDPNRNGVWTINFTATGLSSEGVFTAVSGSTGIAGNGANTFTAQQGAFVLETQGSSFYFWSIVKDGSPFVNFVASVPFPAQAFNAAPSFTPTFVPI